MVVQADIQRYCKRSHVSMQRLRMANDEDHQFLFDSSPVLLNSPNTDWQKQTWQLKAKVFPMRPNLSRARFVVLAPAAASVPRRDSVKTQGIV